MILQDPLFHDGNMAQGENEINLARTRGFESQPSLDILVAF